MTRRRVLLLVAALAATGLVGSALVDGTRPAAPRSPVVFASAEEVRAALAEALPCEPVPTCSRHTSSCSLDAAVLIFALCDPYDGPGRLPRSGSVLSGAHWCADSVDVSALRAAQQALGGSILVRAGNGGRMQGYVPPCRVETRAGSALTSGVHLDADGHCPPS